MCKTGCEGFLHLPPGKNKWQVDAESDGRAAAFFLNNITQRREIVHNCYS